MRKQSFIRSTINRVPADDGKTERSMLDFLYVGKDRPEHSVREPLSPIGDIFKLKSDEAAEWEYHSKNHVRLDPYLINWMGRLWHIWVISK